MEKRIIFDFYRTLYNPKTDKLYRGTFSLLKKLKEDYDLVLITTESRDKNKLINKLKLVQLFSKIIFCKKKSDDIFMQYILKNGLTVVIGDREEEEIAIAKRLCLKNILVNPNVENPSMTIKRMRGGENI